MALQVVMKLTAHSTHFPNILRMKLAVLVASLSTVLAGCASVAYTLGNPSLALAQTPGEYFRQYLVKADAECREKQLGPYLPSDEPQGSPRRANATCRFMFLKPWQPGDSPESAYAHSLKLPPPHDKPVDVYKPGMSPREYFEALCAAQAGEFIFRKVEGRVDSIAELRPRDAESSERNRHLTAFEDPATYGTWTIDTPELLIERGYLFAERVGYREGKRIVERWSKGSTTRRATAAIAATFQSRYSYTWRGIRRTNDLELGVAGGEVLVVDLQTDEVLGYKRDFSLRYLGKYGTEQRISATGFEQGYKCSTLRPDRLSVSAREAVRFIESIIPPK